MSHIHNNSISDSADNLTCSRIHDLKLANTNASQSEQHQEHGNMPLWPETLFRHVRESKTSNMPFFVTSLRGSSRARQRQLRGQKGVEGHRHSSTPSAVSRENMSTALLHPSQVSALSLDIEPPI